jgi:hypothetical protein
MKKNMVNKAFLLAVAGAGLLLALSSCKKYLDVENVSTFDVDYVFDNVPNAQKVILGAYQSLTGDNGYGIRASMYYPYDNDEMMGQGATPYPDNDRRDIAHFSVTAGNTQIANPFNQFYAGIERANLCIYYIPKMDLYTKGSAGEQADLKRLYGEALGIRAMLYLELIRNWGDVPAHYEPSFTETVLYRPKTNRDSIYDHILNDLQLAETLVPWRSAAGNVTERLTQGAIRGLRARIALFRGGYSLRAAGSNYGKTMARPADYLKYYQIARDECDAIMQRRTDHNLNPSFQAVFKNYVNPHVAEPNGEVMFDVAMAGGTGTYDSKLGYYNGPRYNNLGNSALTILPSYFYLFDSLDTRRDVTCAPYDINADNTKKGRTGQTIVDGKYRRDWTASLSSGAQYFGTNWVALRFSDILLMYAEAVNEINNGPTPAAVAAFEEVRKRGFAGNTSQIGTTPTGKDNFFKAIVRERSLEFGGEGIRKYDLIRWNLLNTALTETKANLTRLSTAAAMLPPSYMSPQPTYSLSATLPASMYYKNASTDLVWSASYYKAASTATPTGYTKVAWISNAIGTTISTYYAISFTPNKNELLPIAQTVIDASNGALMQDYGY